MTNPHPWKLVAPWYHWGRQQATEGRKPWQTRPVFQKFDQPDFVKSFTRDPQRSLKFTEPEDLVFNPVVTQLSALSSGPLKNKLTRLFAPKPWSAPPDNVSDAKLAPTGVRKLYLATHKRFYLVVCELHCHVPGFPNTTPDQVCQAGFVVRRRSLQVPAQIQTAARKEANQLLQEIDAIQAELGFWNQSSPATGFGAERRAQAVQEAQAKHTFASTKAGWQAQLDAAQQKLLQWRSKYGVSARLEGWFPGEFEPIGSWESVAETPPEVAEASFPLFALFPDPKVPDHSAKGRNIYFGVVPTSSLDTDDAGVVRLDSDATYEIRCFVRRHKAGCPRRKETPDCHGEIVWSESTESYRLATPTDLIGTSNQPVTLRMPDFAELAAQAAALPVRRLAPVRVVHPQSMKFNVDDGKATGGGIGGFQICFISIPLITIVAMFVLKLFLPIVTFLFGLFFLLRLKFCIPPSLDLNAAVFGKVAAVLPKLEADASLDVDLELDAEFGAGFTLGLNADLRNGMADENGIVNPDERKELEVFSNAALLPVGVALAEAKALTGDDGLPKPEAGLDLTASLEFETRVEAKANGSAGGSSGTA